MFLVFRRKMWFSAVEAARGRVPMFMDKDAENDEMLMNATCNLDRMGMRQWIATGRQNSAELF